MVLRAKVEDEAQASALHQLSEIGIYDFWTEAVPGRTVDIRTSPEQTEQLGVWLGQHGITWNVMIEDVGVLMEAEKASSGGKSHSAHSMDWTSYHALEDIYGWFDYLDSTFDFCEKEVIGQTHEGQDMIVMKVCKGGCGNKPAMWIDSGIHAREWISPATGTWMLNELVENDANHPELTDGLDWYFLPSHNPDGYRKSRDDDRMWRKTTTKYDGDICQGTDANRNWDFHWSETGASGDSCSQLILFPWGYTETPAPGYDAMYDLAVRGNDALHAVHGEYYEAGCIPCVLYTAAGTSLDWALGVAHIPYVYSIELRDTGAYGFILPPEQIIPTAEEAWAFHKVAAEQMITEFGSK